LKIIKCH